MLVSWLRDFDFWKIESRRAGGLDLVQLSQHGRFLFIDGLTNASFEFQPSAQNNTSPKSSHPPLNPSTAAARGIRPQVGLDSAAQREKARQDQPTAYAEHNTVSNPTTSHSSPQQLGSTELSTTKSQLTAALSSFSIEPSSIMVILDGPDFLIAANPSPTPAIPTLQALLMDLRRHPSVHSTIINISSSIAMPIHDAHEDKFPTALETAQNAFAVGLAHQADLVMQLRALDTGAAKDVTGVLRITTGRAAEDDCGGDGGKEQWKEWEVLYHVRNDGSVRVWERGEGVG